MASRRKEIPDRQMVRERFSAGAARLTIALAGRPARLGVLFLAVAFCFWQLYAFAWVPLAEQAALPAGLTSVSAELDVATLAKVRDARAARLQRRPNLFATADQYFSP